MAESQGMGGGVPSRLGLFIVHSSFSRVGWAIGGQYGLTCALGIPARAPERSHIHLGHPPALPAAALTGRVRRLQCRPKSTKAVLLGLRAYYWPPVATAPT